MNRRERLAAAKTLIEQKGWCQGDKVFDPLRRHGYCVATAISAVADKSDDGSTMMSDIKFLQTVNDLPQQNRGVGPWNDGPDRTKAHVLAAFDKAIEAA